MADIAQIEAALVKADAAGDADAARAFAGEIRRMRGAPVMQKLPTMGDSIKEELAGRLDWEKNLAGVGTAVDNAAMRLKQVVGGTLNPQETANVRANRDLNQSGQVMAGNIAGNLAMTAVPGAALYRGATALAGRVLPAMLAPTLAGTVGGATTGATEAGLTQPVLPGESTAKNMGAGAIGGALGDTAARVGSRLIQPIMQSAPVQTLLRHDVVPTPGQAAGPNSVLGRLEQKLQSVFGVGEVITGGRQRAGQEFNRAAINQAVPQGQPAIRAIGDEGINQLEAATAQNYGGMLAGRTVRPDQQLIQDIVAAANQTRLPLSAAGNQRFDDLINRLFLQRIPAGGTMPAAEMKAQIIGDLGHAAQQFRSSADAEQRALGDALGGARNAVQRWMMQRAGVPARELAMADTAYSAQKAVERASDRALGRGEFSPLQLLRQANPGSATERLAQAGQAVLPGVIPNSGTIDRATVAALMMGGAAEGSHRYFGTPQYLTSLALAPLLYSRAGSRYALGDLIPGQQALAAGIRATAPYAAQVGGNERLNALMSRQQE